MAEVDLFQKIDFISHAGIPMSYKIECDGINKAEWSALAEMIMDFEKRPFSKVVGIPRGGLPLQWALEPYVTEGNHPWMVVDDVYTTGTSFREYCTTKDTMFAIKWVIFARKPINPNDEISALFTMPGEQNVE